MYISQRVCLGIASSFFFAVLAEQACDLRGDLLVLNPVIQQTGLDLS